MQARCDCLGSRRLSAWRQLKGLTQRQASHILGVDQGFLSRMERGLAKPGRRLAAKIESLTEGSVPFLAWDAGEAGSDMRRSSSGRA